MLLPVVMAGGSGSRLWPLSRQQHPKQFLNLHGDTTLFQQALSRLEGLKQSSPIIICNEEHRFLVAEQVRQLAIENAEIILEPIGRNTAPAIALAALQAITKGDDPVLLVLAADHYIEDNESFLTTVESAELLALQGKLVTFGVVPTKPETGYGYIQRGKSLINGYEVNCFVEKPNLETAQTYLDTNEYYWNSGMFMFKASVFLKALETFRPDIFLACQKAMSSAKKDLDFIRIDTDAFNSCPSESIDYAVMEKTQDAVVVPLDAGWSDVGSWSALWEVGTKDTQGNVSKGDILSINTKNSFIYADHKLVTTVGIDSLVVVETKDAVLIADRNSVQDVKKVVDCIKQDGRHEHLNHREVYRPWGYYDSIDKGERYQVKRITVKPGHKSSVQMHHHRAEHWIVVSGTAKVTLDQQAQLVTENQSVYIPVGKTHCLENPGKIPLELIEVQTGPYLGEDDIVRIEDSYGRN